jgi:hypothetical protein
MKRHVLLLGTITCAVGMNLLSTRWGTERSASPVMTISTSDDGSRAETTGLYAAPWLEHAPWLAFGLGILVPMGLLGAGAYYLVRPAISSRD